MAADLSKLANDFRPMIDALIGACRAAGIAMRPYEGLRDPFQQARFWRQSRSREEIHEKIAELIATGSPFLAECLSSVGPQSGNPVTNAIPGLSWHQFGEAVDFFWLLDGKAVWSATTLVNGVNGYHVLAERAEAMGLTSGGRWANRDWPHIQLRSETSPTTFMTIQEIDTVMRQRFGT